MQSRVDEVVRTAIKKMSANDVVQRRRRRKLRSRDLQFVGQAKGQRGVEVLILRPESHDRFADDRNDPSLFDEDDQVFPEIGVES